MNSCAYNNSRRLLMSMVYGSVTVYALKSPPNSTMPLRVWTWTILLTSFWTKIRSRVWSQQGQHTPRKLTSQRQHPCGPAAIDKNRGFLPSTMTSLNWRGCESKQQPPPPPYVLSLLFFLVTQCALLQVNQTLQHVANVTLGSAKFWLIRQGQHPETTLIFAPPFPIYLHHPHACSIIPHIGLSSPRTFK